MYAIVKSKKNEFEICIPIKLEGKKYISNSGVVYKNKKCTTEKDLYIEKIVKEKND